MPGWVWLHLLAPPHNFQQLGIAGLDKAVLKGPALSVSPTCLISLLPELSQGAGGDLAGRGERVSWGWLSSRTDRPESWQSPRKKERKRPWESNVEQWLGT